MADVLEISRESESDKGWVEIWRLNRPEVRNALNLELRKALAKAAHRAATEPKARCVIITGDDKAFAAGADIRLLAGASANDVKSLSLHLYWEAITAMPQPVIAAVEGLALGAGCELAMAADMIVAAESAIFGQPEVKLGIMPGAGGTQRLARAIGLKKAMRFALTGEVITGTEAFDWGLASYVTEEGAALNRALDTANAVAALPASAVHVIKQTLRNGMDMPLDGALALERAQFQLLFDTADQVEGMAAFLEKRKPQFET